MEMNDENTFVREVILDKETTNNTSTTLEISQIKEGDVGCVVWDAALVLTHFITMKRSKEKFISCKSVIELGSGTGIVGIASLFCGASNVVLTDLPQFLPLLKHNIKNNITDFPSKVLDTNNGIKEQNIYAKALNWMLEKDTQEILKYQNEIKSKGFDLILVADCVYYKDSVIPLANTIAMLMNSGDDNVKTICCYEERDTGDKAQLQQMFHDILLNTHLFKISFVPLQEQHPVYKSHDIKIMIIEKP